MKQNGRKMELRGRPEGSCRPAPSLIAALVVAALLGCGLFSSGAEAKTTVKYTAKEINDNGGTLFKVSSKGLTGVCCQYNVVLKSGTATLTKLSNGSAYAKVGYYWGVVKKYDDKKLGSTERKKLTIMMQYINKSSSVKNFSYVKSGACKKDIDKAKKVTVPAGFEIYKGNPSNKSQDFVVWKYTKPGSVTLKKTSTDTAISALGGYTFAGIKYQVFQSDKKTKVGVLTCKADGTTNTLTNLKKGTYYAREIQTNGYYTLNQQWLSATVKEGGTGTFQAKDVPVRGRIRIAKGTTDAGSIKAGYSFEGIQYGLFTTRSTTGKRAALFTLNASGVSNLSPDLPIGTYYLREVRTNRFYHLSAEWYPIAVKAGATTNVSSAVVRDVPCTGKISIVKKLEGPGSPDDVFTFDLVNLKNETIAYRGIKVKGDGNPVTIDVLAGTYRLRETDSGEYTDETGDQTLTVNVDETITVTRINRMPNPGSLQVRKTTDDGGTKEGFRFRITGQLSNQGEITGADLLKTACPQVTIKENPENYSLGEWTVDENSLAGLNRAAAEGKTGEYPVVLTAVAKATEGGAEGDGDDDDGDGSSDNDSDDDEGTSNSGDDGEDPGPEQMKDLDIRIQMLLRLEEVAFDRDAEEYQALIEPGNTVITNEETYSVSFRDVTWKGAATPYRDLHTGADHTLLITDARGCGVVEGTKNEGISPLWPGEYTVEEVMTEEQKDRYHRPEKQSKTWTDESNGVFRFDFKNRAKVVPVSLKKTCIDGNVEGIEFMLSGSSAFGDMIRRTGVTDSQGNLDFGTLAKGVYVIEEMNWDGKHYANSYPLEGYDHPAVRLEIKGDEEEPICVAFENKPFAQLRLTKVDKGTGEFLPGATFALVNATKEKTEAAFQVVEEGGYPTARMISSSEDIRSEEGEGDVLITGLVSGDRYEVRETNGPLGYGIVEEPIAFEADHEKTEKITVADERSEIGTQAMDSETGGHLALADEKIRIVDRVTYRNLIPGKEYRLEGRLMDKTEYLISGEMEDVQPAKDAGGKAITASTVFRPETADGSVEVVFEFGGSHLAGHSLVAFETLYTAEGRVTEHEAPEDEDQTVDLPKIGTTAMADDTQLPMTGAKESVQITDTVTYANLKEGRVYRLAGTLMDKTTGRPIVVGGEEVRAEKEFTAEHAAGTVDLTFTFDGSGLAGTSAVCFEELYAEGKLIAEHKDLADRKQTVDFPKIGTVADRPSRNLIVDKVKYRGLIPGKEYVMSGVLMNKATGKVIGGTVSEQLFTPEKSSGEVKITFRISADDLEKRGIGHVVAFETCYLRVGGTDQDYKAIEVASHRDLGDREQTVTIEKPAEPGPGKSAPTGDDRGGGAVAAALLLAAAAVGILAVKLRRRGRNV